MKPRLDLLHLGDLGFTVPAAVAIAAALVASRAGRLALRWCLLFAAAMLAVALNKIAFMTWGAGIDALAFKAVSGHAAGATAVLPFLVYLGVLLLRALVAPGPPAGLAAAPARADRPGAVARDLAREVGGNSAGDQPVRLASMAAGLLIGASVALQLVLRCEHTPAEALAGYAIGAAVSWAAIARAAPGRLRPGASALCFGAAFALAAYFINSLHVAYWMVRAARLLAGGQPLHNLAID